MVDSRLAGVCGGDCGRKELRARSLSLEEGGGFDMVLSSPTLCEIALLQGPQVNRLARQGR